MINKVHLFLSHVVSEEQGGNIIHKPADQKRKRTVIHKPIVCSVNLIFAHLPSSNIEITFS